MKQITSNTAHREKKQLVLENFGGVDFSSSPLNVAKNRASFACNLINDNGVNHKRPGWEERYKLPDKINGEPLENRINGIYHYTANGQNRILVYAGKKFYHIVNGIVKECGSGENDCKVQFFSHGDRVYIIGCGDYLVYGEFDEAIETETETKNKTVYKVKSVAEIAYTPTTSVNIRPLMVDGNGNQILPTRGETLEPANLLTRKRVNTFIGGPEGSSYFTDTYFKLDSANIYQKEGKYYATVNVKKYADNDPHGEDVEILTDGTDNPVGKGFQASYEEIANVTFEFEAVAPEEGAINDSFIRECRFGTLFGAAGASDRLFLSGNPAHPNCDFYSEFNDYTYFTAQSQTVMGSDDLPITGYVRLSDNTLAVMKDRALYEPSVYYRQATEVSTAEDERGKKIAFTKWSGGTGEGCINPYTVASLAEDDLFLSSNGVFGMVEVNNQRTNSRYMRERSRFINGKLLGEAKLNEATAFVYKNRYYLAVPTNDDDERNGVCYVADPRFKNYLGDDIDSTFNYDWWYWENIPARCFAVINGELYFGTEDGRICAFDGEFCDRTYDEVKSQTGNITFKADVDHAFSYGEDLDFSVGDEIIATGDFYCKYLEVSANDVRADSKIHYGDCDESTGGSDEGEITDCNEIYEGTVVYVDFTESTDGNGEDESTGGSVEGEDRLTEGIAYTVKNVDRGTQTFELHNDGKRVNISGGDFTLCRNMKGKTLYVIRVDNGTVTLAELPDGEPLRIVTYNSEASDTSLRICKKKNVVSIWHTPAFDLGATDMLKTMFGMTVTVDRNIGGELEFGYETQRSEFFKFTKGYNDALDFENFSFDAFSFASSFTLSHSVKCKQRKFNYIMFKIISDNALDCAVNNFKMIYTLNNRFKGLL